MEDVWITPSPGVAPPWISDKDVRTGIRGMLKGDRCLEERRRLGLEADNLCHWYGNELTALELTLLIPESKSTACMSFLVLIIFQIKLNFYVLPPTASIPSSNPLMRLYTFN